MRYITRMDGVVEVHGKCEEAVKKTFDRKAYQKKYMEDHKEWLSSYLKEYRELHKEEIKQRVVAWQTKIVECPSCRSRVRQDSLKRHQNSKKCEKLSQIP